LPASDGLKSQRPLAACLALLWEDYSFLLAQKFPTLCLHDEFIFFPRLTAAWDHWFTVAQLEETALTAASGQLAELLGRLESFKPKTPKPESAAEAVLFKQSLESVLRELGPGGPWEWDPFLYLKVAALAWAPVLAQAPHLDWQNQEKVAELLFQTGRLFTWGTKRLRALTQPGKLLSPGALADGRRFFKEVVPDFLTAHFPLRTALLALLKDLWRNLERFCEAVATLPATAAFARGGEGLAAILTQSWGWPGDLKRAAAILREELKESREALVQAAKEIKPRRSWQTIFKDFQLPSQALDLLALYRQEVANLWDFWQQAGVLPPFKGRVVVAETPLYLRTLRSSASYAAPWGPPETSPGGFYLNPETEDLGHHLRHYRFLSAHETVPGHHFLDTLRLSLASPVTRQYESPLFYEGWACYAETLLLSEGYLSAPHDRLVGWQRRLWRGLRGQVDLNLQTGSFSLEDALKYLRQAGYPEATTRIQVLHLALNPGYQLCYTLGLREVLALKDRFAPALGLARFHEALLSGGQLPFNLVEQRLGEGPGSFL